MAGRLLKLFSAGKSAPQRIRTTRYDQYKEALRAAPVTEVSHLDNGVKVGSADSGSGVTTVGLWIDAGSRYEDSSNNGVSKFLTRVLLKGAEAELDSLGARIFAKTERDHTAFYARCSNKDVPKLVETLSNAIQNPTLNDADIDRARADLARELELIEYENPRGLVLDYLYASAYQNTPFAASTYGTSKNIESISKDALLTFIGNHYKGSRVALAAAGGVKHNELVTLAEKNLGKLNNDGEPSVTNQCNFTGSYIFSREDDAYRAYIALAVQGAPLTSPDRFPLLVATKLVGSFQKEQGPGERPSTLPADAGAQDGTADKLESFCISGKDNGLFGAYFECDYLKCWESIFVVQHQWKRLSLTVTEAEVERAKAQLMLETLKRYENVDAVCDDIGQQLLSHGSHISLNEFNDKISKITADDIRAVASKYIYDKCPVATAYGKIEDVRHYIGIRQNMKSLVF